MQIEDRHELWVLLQDRGIHRENLVKQQIDSAAVFDDVLMLARVTGNQHRTTLVVDAISDGGLRGAVVDRKCGHLDPISVEYDAVLVEVAAHEIDLRLVGARSNVRRVGLGKVANELLGADGPYDLHRPRSPTPCKR